MAEHSVFVLLPFAPEFADVYYAIREAAALAQFKLKRELNVFRSDEIFEEDVESGIRKSLSNSDLIIADVTDCNPNVFFEIGYAESAKRPIIFIGQRNSAIPFNVASRRVRIYDRDKLHVLIEPLAADIVVASESPEQFVRDESKPGKPKSVPSMFVSYSHADASTLKRLQVHLRPLVKKGSLDVWVDTRIKTGDLWKAAIEKALSNAAIAVLLISADFLASDFIVDNELPPLLEGAEKNGTRILPIILRPCRFARDPHLSRFQALNAPDAPLLLMDENEQERIWDQLAREIENELDSRL